MRFDPDDGPTLISRAIAALADAVRWRDTHPWLANMRYSDATWLYRRAWEKAGLSPKSPEFQIDAAGDAGDVPHVGSLGGAKCPQNP